MWHELSVGSREPWLLGRHGVSIPPGRGIATLFAARSTQPRHTRPQHVSRFVSADTDKHHSLDEMPLASVRSEHEWEDWEPPPQALLSSPACYRPRTARGASIPLGARGTSEEDDAAAGRPTPRLPRLRGSSTMVPDSILGVLESTPLLHLPNTSLT